jgi:hypothetical protein
MAIESQLELFAQLPDIIKDFQHHLAVVIEMVEMQRQVQISMLTDKEQELDRDGDVDSQAMDVVVPSEHGPSDSGPKLDNHHAGLNVSADDTVESGEVGRLTGIGGLAGEDTSEGSKSTTARDEPTEVAGTPKTGNDEDEVMKEM